MTLALLLATLASGPFEGTVTQRFESRLGKGTVTTAVSRRGLRSEAEARISDRAVRTVVVVTADKPGVGRVWDAAARSWREVPLAGNSAQAPSPLTARRLADEKLLGVVCARVLLEGPDGTSLEYWTTRAIPGDAALQPLVVRAAQLPPHVEKALAGAGALGFVMKLVHRRHGATEMTLSPERIDRGAVAPDLLATP